VALLAFACYVQTAGYGLVWDDNLQLTNNDRIRSFANLGTAFTEQFWAFMGRWHYYRPLQTVSYMIGYAIGGLSPAPYHWLNIILHVLASLAVFWFGWELFRNSRIALWGGLLFAAHPMHTESVAWSAAITDVGCALFYFLALVAWRRSSSGKRPWLWLAASAIALLMALLYKEMALTFPIFAIALDWIHEKETGTASWAARLLRSLPWAIALAVYLALRIHALGSFAPATKAVDLGPLDWLLTLAYLLGHYLQKLLLPVGHNAFYVFAPFSHLSVTDWVLPLLLLLGWAWLSWKLLREDVKLLFLAGWTILTLAPVLNIGGIGQNVFAERYLYIPSLGACLLLAALAERYGSASSRVRWSIAGAVIVAGLAFLTLHRNPVWQDDRTLLTVTLGFSPDIVKNHQDLGIVYLEKGDLPAALNEFETALATEARIFLRSPQNRYAALLGISAVHLKAGRLEEAWNYAAEARDLFPQRAEAYRTLGLVRFGQHRNAEAEELLNRAVAMDPADSAARVNLGILLLSSGKPTEATLQFRAALAQEPHSVPARLGLALSLNQNGRRTEALALVREVLAVEPSNPDALTFLKQLNSGTVPGR